MIKKYFLKFNELIRNPKYQSIFYVFWFMILTYSFHLLWRMFSNEINSFEIISSASAYLANQVFIWSEWFNRVILDLSFYVEEPNTFIFPSVNGYIAIVEACGGMKQMYQVFFLFMLFPGPWKHKLWYIPMSFFVMFLTNVFRIIALSIVILISPEYWHFIHDWILRPFFYVVLFGLWVIWVEYFVTPPDRRKKINLFRRKINQKTEGK